MISTGIVALTLIFIVGYSLAFLVSPAWRRRIEQPKYQFQQQLAQCELKQECEPTRECKLTRECELTQERET